MKKRKWDILLPIIIILVMALILAGYQLAKESGQSNATVEIHLSENAGEQVPVVPGTGEERVVLPIEYFEDFSNRIVLYKK